jgi:anti-sigma regulatory factor (Ser/Thr protein kinase)
MFQDCAASSISSAVHGDPAAAALAHQALFYRSDAEYLDGVLQFVAAGAEDGAPLVVAVPEPRAALLREPLSALNSEVELLDMVEVGPNPGRLIPAIEEMLARHGGRVLHYVGEHIWAGRSRAEIREVTRHEALVNLAWPGASIRVLCPYDAEALDGSVLADAERTHPWVIRAGEGSLSPQFTGATVPARFDEALSAPPPGASSLHFGREDLSRLRALVADRAAAAGLDQSQAADLVLAVNEVATNAIKHARAPGHLSLWDVPGGLVCQLEDPGHIADPLAGRRRPSPSVEGGLGLWMVNQLCDLVELRSSPEGTTSRLHMRRR